MSGVRDLWSRWEADIAAIAPEAGTARARAEFDRLIDGWSEPHRSYHGTQHLRELFTALEQIADAGELDALPLQLARLAGWYHDLAYDPRAAAGSNEHRSATLARDHLHALGADPGPIGQVEALILMTADHQAAAGDDQLVDAFHDADLWILGAPPARFDEYCAQVRAEYAHVPVDAYAAGRSAILRGLVAPDRIYRTRLASGWEPTARENVGRELARLTG